MIPGFPVFSPMKGPPSMYVLPYTLAGARCDMWIFNVGRTREMLAVPCTTELDKRDETLLKHRQTVEE